MKISPIPNFGNFGVYVDDIDMDHMTNEEWTELGKLYVDRLLLIFRNIKISRAQYLDWMPKWGPLKSNMRAHFYKKYEGRLDPLYPETWKNLDLDPKDKKWLEHREFHFEKIEDGRFLSRVYGGKDEHGHALGYFSSGEIFWHSNESSSLVFSPTVSLLGWDHMEGSATGFVQTVDLYESFSESFRSELDEMVLIHQYIKGRVSNNEHEDENLALHLQMGFCPNDDAETPMVCTAPNGRRGLHYSVNTAAKIKGMTEEQSKEIFSLLDKAIFDHKWIYDHYYQQNNDLLVFDNSVTLHRRFGNHPERKAFRMQFDVSPLLDSPWLPWQHMEKYNQLYLEEMHELVDIVGGDLQARVKLPKK